MPNMPGMDGQSGNFVLPAALLAQYPALQNLQWDQIPAAEETEMGGRSSFDASSGGEFGFDEDDGVGYQGIYVDNSQMIPDSGYDQKWSA
jgi:hypothetical protein